MPFYSLIHSFLHSFLHSWLPSVHFSACTANLSDDLECFAVVFAVHVAPLYNSVGMGR